MRTSMLALAIAASLAVTAAGPGPRPAAAEEIEETFTKSLPVPANPHVVIGNRFGDTTVRAWDRSEVQVEVTKSVRTRNADRAKKLLAKLAVEIETSGQEARIKAVYPERDMQGGVFGVLFSDRMAATIDLVIRMPAKAKLSVTTTSGDVEVHEVAGLVKVDCTSGDVVVNGARQDVVVDCTSGDVEVSEAGRDVHIRATSGDVTLDRVTGRVDVDATSGDISGRNLEGGGTLGTISGDVEVARSAGELSVTTSSGDASITSHRGRLAVRSSSGNLEVSLLAPLTGPYNLDSSSGTVRLGLPADPSCRLDLSTSAGALHARLPLEVETVNRNHLVATAGKGGSVIEISTASGDILVHAGERDEASDNKDE